MWSVNLIIEVNDIKKKQGLQEKRKATKLISLSRIDYT